MPPAFKIYIYTMVQCHWPAGTDSRQHVEKRLGYHELIVPVAFWESEFGRLPLDPICKCPCKPEKNVQLTK